MEYVPWQTVQLPEAKPPVSSGFSYVFLWVFLCFPIFLWVTAIHIGIFSTMSWCGQGDEECRPPRPDHGANKPLPKETWRSRPWDFHGFFMDFDDFDGFFMDAHGFSWIFMGVPGFCMDFSCIFMDCSWICHGFFMDFSWILMELDVQFGGILKTQIDGSESPLKIVIPSDLLEDLSSTCSAASGGDYIPNSWLMFHFWTFTPDKIRSTVMMGWFKQIHGQVLVHKKYLAV